MTKLSQSLFAWEWTSVRKNNNDIRLYIFVGIHPRKFLGTLEYHRKLIIDRWRNHV